MNFNPAWTVRNGVDQIVVRQPFKGKRGRRLKRFCGCLRRHHRCEHNKAQLAVELVDGANGFDTAQIWQAKVDQHDVAAWLAQD